MSKVIHQMVTDRILAALKQGHVPWQKPWQRLAGVPVLPCNLASQKEYNGINAILLYMEAAMKGHDLPVYMTLKQANAMGGSIQKGAESLPVIFWKQWRKPIDPSERTNGRVEDADAMAAGTAASSNSDEDEEYESIPVLRYYAVFNAEQTHGVKKVEELQERVKKQLQAKSFDPVGEADQILAAAKHNLGCKFIESGNKAAYLPKSDTMLMPHREMFKAPEHFYLTTFHELVHATGHKNRLKRSGFTEHTASGKERDTYAKEELVAEIGACFLANKSGILSPELFSNSTSYLQSWMKRLQDDPKLIISASSQAMRAVEFILHGRQLQEEVVQSATQAEREIKEEAEGVKV